MHGDIYHVLPDSPDSVLEMFKPTKEGITLFASKVINKVHDGELDPLRVRLLCDTLEQVADKIKTATKNNQKTAAAKYGEKPFVYMGAEFHFTATKTEYDYEACNDPDLTMLLEHEAAIKTKIIQRKEWLKLMGNQETVINKLTGEIVNIFPPIKKSTMGVKVTIK